MKKKNCKGCFFLENVKKKDYNFFCVKHGLEIFNPFSAGCKNRQESTIVDIGRYQHRGFDNVRHDNKKAFFQNA